MQQYSFPLNLHVSRLAMRIQHGKQTFETTTVIIKLLQENLCYK